VTPNLHRSIGAIAKPSVISVMLIEDNEMDARVIQRALGAASDIRFELERAKRLDDGLDQLTQNHFDVLLLDLNLPDSSGIQTTRTVRLHFPYLPIVVLTGTDQFDVGLEAINAGAQDYLPKKRMDSELLVRSLFYAMQRVQIDETNRQLAAAREIQDRLSPSSPPSVAGFDIAGICHPASVAGGDYFDYVRLSDGTWGILVADVSGSGLAAATLMGETRASIRALASTNMNATSILNAVHKILYEESPSDKFITLFFLHLDPQRGTISHIGAGHEAYFLRGGTDTEVLRCTTLPLAVDEEINCQLTEPIALSDGDIVVLLTDGITEAHSAKDELFGIERSLDVVRANSSRPASEIVEALYNSTFEFVGNDNHDDDATVVIVKVTS
jgi:serine phosphatase RsbU (regulator of sigma subunit)